MAWAVRWRPLLLQPWPQPLWLIIAVVVVVRSRSPNNANNVTMSHINPMYESAPEQMRGAPQQSYGHAAPNDAPVYAETGNSTWEPDSDEEEC